MICFTYLPRQNPKRSTSVQASERTYDFGMWGRGGEGERGRDGVDCSIMEVEEGGGEGGWNKCWVNGAGIRRERQETRGSGSCDTHGFSTPFD